MIYDFGYREIDFNLSDKDLDHALLHKTRMKEWTGPIFMDALSGVGWDKVLRNFPFYSLRCRDCKYIGDDYEENGGQRNSSPNPIEEKRIETQNA